VYLYCDRCIPLPALPGASLSLIFLGGGAEGPVHLSALTPNGPFKSLFVPNVFIWAQCYLGPSRYSPTTSPFAPSPRPIPKQATISPLSEFEKVSPSPVADSLHPPSAASQAAIVAALLRRVIPPVGAPPTAAASSHRFFLAGVRQRWTPRRRGGSTSSKSRSRALPSASSLHAPAR
jgi:hypothetical protein